MSLCVLLSPAKKQAVVTLPVGVRSTQPQFKAPTRVLIHHLKTLNAKSISKQLGISVSLGELNYQRYQNFNPDSYNKDNAHAAMYAFTGDVYRGFDVASLDVSRVPFMQAHLRLLSGLYGMLRPLDLMQPYRLEMGARLDDPRYANLYDYWQGILHRYWLKDKKSSFNCVINLASKEYASVLSPSKLPLPWIDIVFQQRRADITKTIALFAKRARGKMARFIVDQSIDVPEGIQDFKVDGYRFMKSLSSDDRWVFVTSSL